jgi:polyphosphate kinase
MQKMKRLPPSDLFLNREISVLAFNERVLSIAEDDATPLLERLRFLCIVSSNLDEFFEIRVAGLKEQMREGGGPAGPDGGEASEVYSQVARRAQVLVARKYSLLNMVILPRMRAEGVALHLAAEWTGPQLAWARTVFDRDVKPLLTPIGLDPAHPFPRVLNKSLNFAVALTGRDAYKRNASIAILQAPRALPRLMQMPRELSGYPSGFVMLTSFVQAFVGDLFPGMKVQGCYQFRLTRNSDLFVDEEEITNLRQALQGELTQRHFGDAVRLELADACPPDIEAFLLGQFGLGVEDCYHVAGPVNLNRLLELVDAAERPDLKYPRFRPGLPAALESGKARSDLFRTVSRTDILLHHPFQSFQPVIDFLTAAAADPQVVAIKQTIYRTGEESVLMEILLNAARAGKEVTVVVELMARFEEETNINLASRLEEVGAHVVYGVVGHKTHAKMMLVLRREKGRIKRYAHLGTGNYHPGTARAYTDFGLFTAEERITADVDKVFQQLTGLGEIRKLACLLQAPFTLHPGILNLIRREARHARAGKKAVIVAKMNALLEPTIILALYKASQAGVTIDLIVRGACALRPGVAGLSDNIRVRSVVGRFLEHTRVFHFHNAGDDAVYLSSADWMDRNFFRRVEACFPVLDKDLKKRVIDEGLKPYLKDTQLSWAMQSDGTYRKVGARHPFNAHEALLAQMADEAAPLS